jgi:hypothetical protein
VSATVVAQGFRLDRMSCVCYEAVKTRMKRATIALWAVGLLTLRMETSSAKADAPAIPSLTASPVIGYAYGGAGFAFSPRTNLLVTSLGYNANGFASYPGSDPTVRVSLFSSGGGPLTSALVTTNGALHSGNYFTSITSISLTMGATYYLQAGGVADGVWVGRVIAPGLGGAFTVAPQLTYLGGAVGTNPSGVFPANVYGSDALWIGGNFEFAPVPEPSAVGLLGLSLVAFRRLLRRR